MRAFDYALFVVDAHDTEGNIGVALGGDAEFALALGAALGAAVGARGVVGAALDHLFALLRGGAPLPTVAPHIDGPAGTQRLGIARDGGGGGVALAAVEVGILGHVAGGKLPFALGGQTVGGLVILSAQPNAVGVRIGVGDVGDRVVLLPGRRGAPLPTLRRGPRVRRQELGIVAIGHRRVGNIHILRRANQGQKAILTLARPGPQPRVGEAAHILLNARLARGVHLIDNLLHLLDLRGVLGRALEFGQLRLLPANDGIVIRGDLLAQRLAIFLRGLLTVGGNQRPGFLVEFGPLLLDGGAEAEELGLALTLRPRPYRAGKAATQNQEVTCHRVCIHSSVPFYPIRTQNPTHNLHPKILSLLLPAPDPKRPRPGLALDSGRIRFALGARGIIKSGTYRN